MASTNKTSLGLNMWEASDKPVRQDFVNDNVIIDEKITKLNSDLQDQIATSNSNLSNVSSNLISVSNSLNTLKSKAPSDLGYIESFYVRYAEQANRSNVRIIDDVSYIVNDRGIKIGSYGFARVTYSDGPSGIGDYGYVEFFKHADGYVTVKLYPENVDYFYIGRFILGQTTWSSPWRQI